MRRNSRRLSCPTGKCSHGRAYEFFAETIANPGAFRDAAWLCEDEWAALHGTCEKSATLATLGEHLDFRYEWRDG